MNPHLPCPGQSDPHSTQMSALPLWHSRAQGNRFWQTPPSLALCSPIRSPGRFCPYARWSYVFLHGTIPISQGKSTLPGVTACAPMAQMGTPVLFYSNRFGGGYIVSFASPSLNRSSDHL